MTDKFEVIEQEPYKQGKCEACGACDWANAKLSPRTFRPLECDLCPPKDKDTVTPKASGVVE